MPKSNPKIKKDFATLIQRLISHLEILVELSDKAFYNYEHEKYIGEVASKLRVLVIKTRTNKPLLIDLMYQFEYERTWENPGSPEFTLRTYMYYFAVYIKDKYTFTNEKFVRYLSQQSGGSHEDWEIDEGLHEFLYGRGARSCDSSYAHRVLRVIVNAVLVEASLFLLYLHYVNTLKNLGVKYNLRQILNINTHYDHALDWNLKSRKEKNIEHKIKPIKQLLHHFDTLHQAGKSHLFAVNIPGIVPKEELKQNGRKEKFWTKPEFLKKNY